MKKRLRSAVLLTAAVLALTWAGLTARGALLVRADAVDWRMLAYITPAARYELCAETTVWPVGEGGESQKERLLLDCYDAQERVRRSILLTTEDTASSSSVLPWYTDYRYDGDTRTEWSHEGPFRTSRQRITTDAKGRIIRVETDSGSTEMRYDDTAHTCGIVAYDSAGAVQQTIRQVLDPRHGKPIRSETYDAADTLLDRSESEWDEYGHLLSTRGEVWKDPRALPESYAYRYQLQCDERGNVVRRRETTGTVYANTERFTYDEQGRQLLQQSYDASGTLLLHVERRYTDITRR